MDIARLMADLARFTFDALEQTVSARYRARLDGIEVTQAIQYYDSEDHLTDPADRGADNSITLVAGKPAWVRVYVGSVFGASGVTGTLEIQRRTLGTKWKSVDTLSADPSSMTSVPASVMTTYAEMRGGLGSTLNFVIPGEDISGVMRLIARVTVGTLTFERVVDVDATLRQTLRLAGIMISYNGPASSAANAPNLTIAAPALAALQAMSGTALTLFPVESTAEFRTAGSLALTNHLQDTVFPTSGCGAAWDTLHARVANARTADGNQPGWVYYGLLPAGVPMGPVGGCGGGSVAVGPVNEPGILAHEAGHACGLGHAPAGSAPNPDPSYPAYEPYDPAGVAQASIGEFGLDTNNGKIMAPQVFRDFMSYATMAWISPYHYGRLLNNATLSPTVEVDYPWWKDYVWEEIRHWPPFEEPDPPPFDLELPVFPPSRMNDVISLIVKVEHGKVAEVMHVARTRAHTELVGAASTSFTARLLDSDGAVLARGALRRLDTAPSGCGSGCDEGEPTTYLAQAFLADVAPGAMLDIAEHDSGEVVWRREAPAEAPRVEGTGADVDSRGDVTVTWQASDEVAEFWLRWSRDGEKWQTVATGLEGRETRIAAGGLPSGDGLLEVVAHDGFHSSHSQPFPVSVPDRAPDVVILHPVEGHTYAAGQTLRLWASTANASHGAAVWLENDREVARGLDAFVRLEPGERTLTVRIDDRLPATASVTVTVTPERS